MKSFLRALIPLAAAALVAFAVPASAHGTSSIQGVVSDSRTGRALAGVSVNAYHARSHIFAGSARSARDGSFHIWSLAAGEYQLFATKPGYRAVEVSGLTVESNDHVVLGFAVPLERALSANPDPVELLARCNDIVNPDETSDVYYVCGGR